MTQPSATEPKNLTELCEMQEGLLQRCLSLLEDMDGESGPGVLESRYQDLMDDLRAHVDPDALPPADARLLAMANAMLHEQLQETQERVLELELQLGAELC